MAERNILTPSAQGTASGFRIRVPASTSNLGSGFDTVSVALSLYLELAVTPIEAQGLQWEADPELPSENILEQALARAAKYLSTDVGGLRISMRNPIPLGRGLGSSGAAIVGGIKIVERLAGAHLSDDEILEIGYPLEGHPDNLAASLMGGWVISRVAGETVRAERLRSQLKCRFVAVVPELRVSTQQARAILPTDFPLEDAVFNLQRCALLVHAVTSGKAELLSEATADRLHQPHRARLVPGAESLLAREGLGAELSDSLLALTVSGSGSTLIAVVTEGCEAVGEWMVDSLARAGTPSRSMILDLDSQGAAVTGF